jgi:hypothetical protein
MKPLIKKRERQENTLMEKTFHQAQVASLYLKGMTQKKISDEVGCSIEAVRRHMETLRDSWMEKSLYDFSQAKAEQLAKVDEVERVSWEQFAKSADKESLTEFVGSNEEVTNSIRSTSKNAQEIKWLDKIQWCIDQRCKILGLYAPKQQIIQQTITDNRKLEEMTTDELMKIANKTQVPALFEVEPGVEIGSEEGEVDLTDDFVTAKAD